ncbi:MAG: hypothetical protein ABUL58_01380 [Steroidobacter sp.]
MSPLAVLTAIILGSAIAIGFGLCTVWFLAFWLRGESRQLASELVRLPLYCGLFVALSAIAASALIGLYKKRHWRWWAQAAMWSMVALLFAISWRK